jgi:FAD/FMN-containing dehydrogenase
LLRRSEYTPLAAELISPALARHLELDGASLLIRLGGNETFVRAANEAMTALGETRDAAESVWNRLSAAEPTAAVVVRVSTLPSRIGDMWERAVNFADRGGGYAHATLSRGVVRCILPAPAHDAPLTPLSASLTRLADGMTIVGERLPATLWSTLTRPRSSDSLAAGVRHAFDPDRVMNPGILGGL